MITILIMAAILMLAVYLVAFAAAQALGEHNANAAVRRRHHRR